MSAPFDNMNSAQFEEKIAEAKDAVVLDVRTDVEFEDGYIPGAINIDVNEPDFADKITALDKSKTYLVYCRSGKRSVNACLMMKSAGFENLINLEGGILEWDGDVAY